MILSEKNIRKIIRIIVLNEVEDFGDIDLTLKGGGQHSGDDGGDGQSFGSGNYVSSVPKSAESDSAGYVFPVGVINGKSYKNAIASIPQEVRTDVDTVTDSKTGKKEKRGDDAHKGYDIGCPTGTPLVAIADGKVIASKHDAKSGNYIVTFHEAQGVYALYCHMKTLGLSTGSLVIKGDVIGISGATGKVTGPHLHFGFKRKGAAGFSFKPNDYNSIMRAPEVVVTLSDKNQSFS